MTSAGTNKMNRNLLFVSLVLSIGLSVSSAQNDGRAIYAKSDNKLNDVYGKLLRANRSNNAFLKSLRNAENKWIQFRNAQFALEHPKHVSFEQGGPIPMDQAMCLARLTDERTKTLLKLLKASTDHEVYVSDMKVIYSSHVHAGVGIDKPYWGDDLRICGMLFVKGVLVHPEAGGAIAVAEFLLPEQGGHLLGTAGWADEAGAVYHGKMRYRFFVDGDLLYSGEIRGKTCQEIDLDLGSGKVLRIEADDGGDGNYSDHMAFGDLRVVH